MAFQPYTKEQLNYFKFTSVVQDEFPKALRQTFVLMWDTNFGYTPGFQLWDDSIAVRNMFLGTEGGKTKIPIHASFQEWDCTALFQATIFAKSFALPDSTGHQRILSDLYAKPRKLPHGTFHHSVISSNNAETFTLAVDQLRLLRNTLCHSANSRMEKKDFDQHMQLTKDAFVALGVNTVCVDAVVGLSEVDFPTAKVQQLNENIAKEKERMYEFVEQRVEDSIKDVGADVKGVGEDVKGVATDVKGVGADVKGVGADVKGVGEDVKGVGADVKGVGAGVKDVGADVKGVGADVKDVGADVKGVGAHVKGVSADLKGVATDLKDVGEEVKGVGAAVKGVSADVKEIKKNFKELTAKLKEQEALFRKGTSGTPYVLPKSCVPSMVPHFTGRDSECDEILSHMTSESVRLVTICGAPGFGKTSLAIAVGHRLDSRELPVYYLSMRSLKSKDDFTSKLLGLFRQSSTSPPGEQSLRRLAPADELCQVLGQITDRFFVILDNADEFFYRGGANVTEEVVELMEEIFARCQSVTFLCTTRESLQFMNLQRQDHEMLRLNPLDHFSSMSLAHQFLDRASEEECSRIARICGRVPLAIRLMCSLISEDAAPPSQCLDEFVNSNESILEMLDRPDYPQNLRLKCLFDSSFCKLSKEEQEAFVSLSVFPGSFDVEASAAVMGVTSNLVAKRILSRLQRASLIDSSPKTESFLIHPLIQSFAMEKGKHEMKEVALRSKARFYNFYVSLLRELNGQFLTGHSMSASQGFYVNRRNIRQTLLEGYSDYQIRDRVFDVLMEAELFLHSVLRIRHETVFDKIYNAATEAAKQHKYDAAHSSLLLVARAVSKILEGKRGRALELLLEAEQIQDSCSPVVSDEALGKRFCYHGIYLLITGELEDGIKLIEDSIPLLNRGANHTIHRVFLFQILGCYYLSTNDSPNSSRCCQNALKECQAVGDERLLLISTEKTKGNVAERIKEREVNSEPAATLLNQPLCLEIVALISVATTNFSSVAITDKLVSAVLRMQGEVESEMPNAQIGLRSFLHSISDILEHLTRKEEAILSYEKRIELRQVVIKSTDNSSISISHQCALAWDYCELGGLQYSMQDYTSALQSFESALDIRLKLFGEEHADTAGSYHNLGLAQGQLNDCTSSLKSLQSALGIRLRLLGKEHADTARSYHELAMTQTQLKDHTSALQSLQSALDIRLKLLGEESADTAWTYYFLGMTQGLLNDHTSALQSLQHALDIRMKLFGEEHADTAESFHELGIAQMQLEDHTSALQSLQRALDIRSKLFGEEHADTAESYTFLGITQGQLEDHTSTLQSLQRALDIRLKLFGEEHADTAGSYHNLGLAQGQLNDYTSALQSFQSALDIRLNLFGDDHADTAGTYHELGIIQGQLNDYTSALQSLQSALDIRLKLLGEEHADAAERYHELGITQRLLEDYTSAFQSLHCVSQ